MIVDIVLPLSLAFIMFSLGIGLTLADFTRILSMPRAVLVGLILQVFGIPLLVFGLLQLVEMPPPMAFGFMLLSFCPGGFTSAILTRLAGGSVALSITLTAVVSLLSVITVPFLVSWAAAIYLDNSGVQVDIVALGFAMFALTVVPVALGMILARFAPHLVTMISRVVNLVAVLIFTLVILAAVAANWDVFAANVGRLGPFAALIAVIALAIGIGVARALGLERPDATCISIELGVQNSTLGIAVASLIGTSSGLPEFALPLGTYGVMMYVITLPAIFLMRRML